MTPPEDVQAAAADRIVKNAEWAIETLGAENMDGISAVNFAHDILALASRLAAETARADAVQAMRDAGLLLAADIPCNNGCGCEGCDYCAQDEWTAALARYDAAKEA